jgi:drug/metabolite transporter (DMT)-like permease
MNGVFLLLFAILLRVFSNPLGNVFQKQLAGRGKNPMLINYLTYQFLALACIYFMVAVPWHSLPASFWIFSILGGIAGAAGNGFLVRALKTGDLSVLGPINAYKSIVGIVIGIFLLGEIPGWWGLLGVAIIIYGSYFVLDTTEDKFSWGLLKRKEIQYRIWAMMLTGIEAVFIKKVILSSSTLIAFISWCWFGAAFALVYFFLSKEKKTGTSSFTLGDTWKLIYLVICMGTMQYTTNYCFDHMNVGYALAIFQLSILVSVLLGYRFFKEKDILKKLIGAAIMIGGSVLIILLK